MIDKRKSTNFYYSNTHILIASFKPIRARSKIEKNCKQSKCWKEKISEVNKCYRGQVQLICSNDQLVIY